MANVLTQNNILDLLESISVRHPSINSFFVGKDWNFTQDTQQLLPALQVYFEDPIMPEGTGINGQGTYPVIIHPLRINIVTWVKDDKTNNRYVLSDAAQVIQNIVNEISTNPFYIRSNAQLTGDINFTELEEFTQSDLGGYGCVLAFRLLNSNTPCGLPQEAIDGFDFPGIVDGGYYNYSRIYLTCSSLTGCSNFQDIINNSINTISLSAGTIYSGATNLYDIFSIDPPALPYRQIAYGSITSGLTSDPNFKWDNLSIAMSIGDGGLYSENYTQLRSPEIQTGEFSGQTYYFNAEADVNGNGFGDPAGGIAMQIDTSSPGGLIIGTRLHDSPLWFGANNTIIASANTTGWNFETPILSAGTNLYDIFSNGGGSASLNPTQVGYGNSASGLTGSTGITYNSLSETQVATSGLRISSLTGGTKFEIYQPNRTGGFNSAFSILTSESGANGGTTASTVSRIAISRIQALSDGTGVFMSTGIDAAHGIGTTSGDLVIQAATNILRPSSAGLQLGTTSRAIGNIYINNSTSMIQGAGGTGVYTLQLGGTRDDGSANKTAYLIKGASAYTTTHYLSVTDNQNNTMFTIAPDGKTGIALGGIGTAVGVPTAFLDVRNSSANTASFRIRSGSTTPTTQLNGSIWNDGDHIVIGSNNGLRIGTGSSVGSAYKVQFDLGGGSPILFGNNNSYLTGSNALWMGASPTTSNYTLLSSSIGTTVLNGSQNVSIYSNNNIVGNFHTFINFTPLATNNGSAPKFTLTTPADTTMAASTEAMAVMFSHNSLGVQHATGAITEQRDFAIFPRTHRFVGASTITNAASFYVGGPPVAGTNATITNPFSVWISGTTLLQNVTSGAILRLNRSGSGAFTYIINSSDQMLMQGASGLGASEFGFSPNSLFNIGSGLGTLTSRLTISGGNSTYSQLHLRSGGTPSSPTSGEIWNDGTNIVIGSSIGLRASSVTATTVSATTIASSSTGRVILTGGTATVNTNLIGSSSNVFLSYNSNSYANVGILVEDTSLRVNSTSFTIVSSNPLDTSTVSWLIINSI